jgi:hypothetical protein
MTNRRKEIPMRYSCDPDGEIKEILISEDDSVRIILSRLKAKSNFHLTDHASRHFGADDYTFGYVSTPGNPPLKLLHGSSQMGKKREPTPRKDNRQAIEVTYEGAKSVYSRSTEGTPATYARLLADTVTKYSTAGACHIGNVRAEDDRIMVSIVAGDDPEWFTEKSCPPLRSTDDKLLVEAKGAGGWGINPPAPPMQTRAAASKNKAVRVVDVLLHNLGSDGIELIGKATDYSEAIALAHCS